MAYTFRLVQGWNDPEKIARKRLAQEKNDKLTTEQPATGSLTASKDSEGFFQKLWRRLSCCASQADTELDAEMKNEVKSALTFSDPGVRPFMDVPTN